MEEKVCLSVLLDIILISPLIGSISLAIKRLVEIPRPVASAEGGTKRRESLHILSSSSCLVFASSLPCFCLAFVVL